MTGLRLTEPEQLQQALEHGYAPGNWVVFRGKTENTTKTEIFLNGMQDQRLLLPPNSACLIHKHIVVWNQTDQAFGNGTAEGGSASCSNIFNATTGIYTKTATQNNDHVFVDIEAGSLNTDAAFGIFVTGNEATDVLYWEVTLALFCQTLFEATAATGIYDGIQK